MNDSDSPRPATHAFDAMIKTPDQRLLLLENSRVRVLDTKVKPGERTPVHGHEWSAALYVLSWSDFLRYDPQGNVLLDSRNMATKPAIGRCGLAPSVLTTWRMWGAMNFAFLR